MDVETNNAALITSALKDGLQQGIFQDKYKVFCRGISTINNIAGKPRVRFVDEFLNSNGFFLLIDKTPESKFKLAAFLNTGIIEKSRDIIFENVMAIEPTECVPSTTENFILPNYFRIETNGDIIPIAKELIKTLIDL